MKTTFFCKSYISSLCGFLKHLSFLPRTKNKRNQSNTPTTAHFLQRKRKRVCTTILCCRFSQVVVCCFVSWYCGLPEISSGFCGNYYHISGLRTYFQMRIVQHLTSPEIPKGILQEQNTVLEKIKTGEIRILVLNDDVSCCVIINC